MFLCSPLNLVDYVNGLSLCITKSTKLEYFYVTNCYTNYVNIVSLLRTVFT